MSIHVAGPLTDLVQRCSRCGAVLSDYRNAMWHDGQPPPRGFAEGRLVEVEGNYKGVVSDGEATCDRSAAALPPPVGEPGSGQ